MNTSFAPLPDVIEPRWWSGQPAADPAVFTIDCSGLNLDEMQFRRGSELAVRMNDMFKETGLVVVKNTGLSNAQQMRQLAKLVVEKEMVYEAGANPRDNLEPNIYEVGAPLEAWLHYHHEMAYVGTSTKMLAFMARTAVPGRGATFVSDNLQATDALMATELGAKLRGLGLCYHRDLTDREAFTNREEFGVYNHWQKSMLTEDPAVAEQMARDRGLETEWGPERLLKTRYFVSAFEFFPQLDRNVLFSSIADDGMWFDTWPMVQHLPYEQRPLKLTFGDLSELSHDEKALFVDIYDRFGVPIDWRVGDIAVVCNYRWAHGRPGIHLQADEKRELGVLIGEPFDRVGDITSKW